MISIFNPQPLILTYTMKSMYKPLNKDRTECKNTMRRRVRLVPHTTSLYRADSVHQGLTSLCLTHKQHVICGYSYRSYHKRSLGFRLVAPSLLWKLTWSSVPPSAEHIGHLVILCLIRVYRVTFYDCWWLVGIY